jgi:antitoxin HigA-1
MTKMAKKLAPMHPGEVLREEFLVPLNLSAGRLPRLVPRDLDPARANQRRLRLARYADSV